MAKRQSGLRLRTFAGLALVASLMPGLAVARSPDDAKAMDTTSAWQFSVTPYIWASGLHGKVGVFPAIRPVDVDLTFRDIFDHLKIAGMAVFQARKNRFVTIADLSYIKLNAGQNVGIRDPNFATAELDSSVFTSTVAGGYRVVDGDTFTFDGLAGLRVNKVKANVSLTGPISTRSGESSETWVDPLIATRLRASPDADWSFEVYGDVGGFGVGSDVTWQVVGTAQYRIGRTIWLTGGWREYSIDYDRSGFVYDVRMGGPIVGVSFGF